MRGGGQRPEPAVQRDLAVFEELVARYQLQTYRVAYRLTGHREDAQDLIQEALFEAFRNFGRFTPGTRFDRWLYRIMTNRHIDHVRKAAKLPTFSLDQVEDPDGREGSWDVPDNDSDPADRLVDGILEENLQKALDGLPVEYRSAVVLADIEEMSYEEVAGILGCPVGTVRSRLHRGRALLREKLQLRPPSGDA